MPPLAMQKMGFIKHWLSESVEAPGTDQSSEANLLQGNTVSGISKSN